MEVLVFYLCFEWRLARGFAPQSMVFFKNSFGETLHPAQRLSATLAAIGVGDDQLLLSLLEGVDDRPGKLGLKGLYHQARILQRLGRYAEAELKFLNVIERDRGITPFYAMWSELHLTDVRTSMIGACDPEGMTRSVATGHGKPGNALQHEGLTEIHHAEEKPDAPELREVAQQLAPLAEHHAETYPWFGRAEDLLRLGEKEEAGRQLYEAFLAWREARGRPIRRTGLESVARGANRARRRVPWQLRRARRALTTEEREVLIEVGEAIGDIGVSTGWGGWSKINERPRAYPELVEQAARRHGLDPNLLFAVMRVESVYQKEIVFVRGSHWPLSNHAAYGSAHCGCSRKA